MRLKQSSIIESHYALDENGKQQLIIVGVDGNENGLYEGVIAERSKTCPSYCPINSPLI
jgi:hypothetical protein